MNLRLFPIPFQKEGYVKKIKEHTNNNKNRQRNEQVIKQEISTLNPFLRGRGIGLAFFQNDNPKHQGGV